MKKRLCSMLIAMAVTTVLCSMVYAEIDTADHTYSGKLDYTTAADIRVRGGAKLTATSDELNIMDGVTATTTEINTVADGSGVGVGTVSNAAASATESLGQLKQTMITFTNCTVIPTSGGDEGEGTIVYSFPSGSLVLLSAMMTGTVTTSAGTTGAYQVAVGTAKAADDATLTSTEANIIPATTLTPATAAAICTNSWNAVLAAPFTIDSTASAAAGQVWVNFGITNGYLEGTSTNRFTGSLILQWLNGGDNQ